MEDLRRKGGYLLSSRSVPVCAKPLSVSERTKTTITQVMISGHPLWSWPTLIYGPLTGVWPWAVAGPLQTSASPPFGKLGYELRSEGVRTQCSSLLCYSDHHLLWATGSHLGIPECSSEHELTSKMHRTYSDHALVRNYSLE